MNLEDSVYFIKIYQQAQYDWNQQNIIQINL
jgi:hypothetical protein